MDELDRMLERFSLVFVLNDYSPFCMEVRELIRSYPDLDTSKLCVVSSDTEIERAAARKTRLRAPYLFVKGLYMGGSREILSMHESGDLRELFIQSSALTPPDTSLLTDLVKQYPLVLVANSFSPFCLRALGILQTYHVPKDRLKVIMVDQVTNGKALEKAAAYISNRAELPLVFIKGELFGKLDTLQSMHRTCKLEMLLMEKGVLEPPNFDLLNTLVRTQPVVLIGQSFSPFWLGAVEVLESYHVTSQTEFVKVDVRKDGKEIYKAGRCATNSKKMPYVFIGGEYLGGYEDLEMLHRADKLEEELVRGKALNEPEVDRLMQLMRQHDLLLLTSSYSPFCLQTVHLLKNKYRLDQSRLKIVEVDKNPDGNTLKKAAQYVTRQKQPPYFFVNSKHVKGDRNSLEKLDESGELRTILQSAIDL